MRIVDCGFEEFPEKYKNPKYGKFRFAGFRGVRSRRGFLRQPYNEPFPDIVYFLEGIC